mmetsp:Transcript_68874/g.150529  ORF Transcript_68874/g.150529 Transcript_68874/m.150529 type:complete len:102 (+) Transcript_68874:22-327(+)
MNAHPEREVAMNKDRYDYNARFFADEGQSNSSKAARDPSEMFGGSIRSGFSELSSCLEMLELSNVWDHASRAHWMVASLSRSTFSSRRTVRNTSNVTKPRR